VPQQLKLCHAGFPAPPHIRLPMLSQKVGCCTATDLRVLHPYGYGWTASNFRPRAFPNHLIRPHRPRSNSICGIAKRLERMRLSAALNSLRVSTPSPLTILLYFKSLIINDVDLWKNLLTSMLIFKLLAINDVGVVDLCMSIYHLPIFPETPKN
jgi:hypothetical protein